MVERAEFEDLQQKVTRLEAEVAELRRKIGARPATQQDVVRRDLREQIIKYLQEHGRGTCKFIAEKLDSTKAAVSRELRLLIDDHLVDRQKGKYCLVYCLAPHASPSPLPSS